LYLHVGEIAHLYLHLSIGTFRTPVLVPLCNNRRAIIVAVQKKTNKQALE